MFPKRGAIALVTTALALVLLLSFKTPDATGTGSALVKASAGTGTTSGASTGSTSGSTSTGSTSGSSATSGTKATASPAATSATANGTVTGSAVQMPYGTVEVQITVSNGKITDVQAVSLPNRGRSGEISNYVAPILASEALKAQSANIDIVSGATYTSEAYAQSLQSALDQAGIATTQVTG